MSNLAGRFANDYPPDWLDIARAAKERAGWRCVRCRHPFYRPSFQAGAVPLPCDERCDPTRGRRRISTFGSPAPHDFTSPGLNYGVHHLDGDKRNGAWWNLLPMCNSCHLSVQARVIVERQWILDHSPWFVPYVCGYYAAVGGAIDITREDADADPAKWLAIGQPWRTDLLVPSP